MSITQREIPYITIDDVSNHETMERYVYPNLRINYYWSDDFSPPMYIALAQAGFISVTHVHEGRLLLLPEMQTHYAVLEFEDLRIGKRVRQLLRSGHFTLAFNTCFSEVVEAIRQSYPSCWIQGEYVQLMNDLSNTSNENFFLFSTELFDNRTGELIAGEIGYLTNNAYTSLSGFHNHSRDYRNWGTLQMVLLAQHLQEKGVRFWNLGHPYMEYKTDLGAKILNRADFLEKWRNTDG